MNFEFDKQKSKSNFKKHGIDFLQAQILWEDSDRLEVPARLESEKRWILIGKIGSKHWSAIFTIRSNKIRIISVRRSRKEEVEIYES